MYTLISIFVILIFILIIYSFLAYRSLMKLSIDHDNARADIEKEMTHIFEESAKVMTPTGANKEMVRAYGQRNNSKTILKKIQSWNMLLETYTKWEVPFSTETEKFLKSTLNSRRYHRHTGKQLNARLQVFPGSTLGSFLGYTTKPLLQLTEKEKKGETPETKW